MNPNIGSDVTVTSAIIEKGYGSAFNLFRLVFPEIPEKVLEDFREATSIETYKKNSVVIDYGEICRKLFIVIQGYVIIYLHIDGIETPVWFIDVGGITVAVQSFLEQIPGRERQIAVEDTVCIVLNRNKYQELYDKHPAFEKLIGLLFQTYYIEALLRIELSHHPPEARYLHLLEHRADIIRNAKISELAKYLGIARETLSRKRAELTKPKK